MEETLTIWAISLMIGMFFFLYDSFRTQHNARFRREAIDIVTEYVIYMVINKGTMLPISNALNLGYKRNNVLFWAKSYHDYINPDHLEAINLFEQLSTP